MHEITHTTGAVLEWSVINLILKLKLNVFILKLLTGLSRKQIKWTKMKEKKKPKTYKSVNQMAVSILKIIKFINSSSIYGDPEYYSDGKIYELNRLNVNWEPHFYIMNINRDKI